MDKETLDQNDLLKNIRMLSIDGFPVLHLPNVLLAPSTRQILEFGNPQTRFDYFDLNTGETLDRLRERELAKDKGKPKLTRVMLEALADGTAIIENKYSPQSIEFYGLLLQGAFGHDSKKYLRSFSEFRSTIARNSKPFAILNGIGVSIISDYDTTKPRGERLRNELGFIDSKEDRDVLVRDVIDVIGFNPDNSERYSAIIVNAFNPESLVLETNLRKTPIFYNSGMDLNES